MVSFKLVCLLAIVGLAYGDLPEYIKACKEDATFNECAVKQGNSVLPTFLKGDKSYGLENLTPYKMAKVSVSSDNFKLTFNDVVLHGLENTLVTALNVDFEKKHIQLHCSIERAEVEGQYTVEGKFVEKPITGKGHSNITITGVKLEYDLDYEVEKRDDGKEYLKTNSPKLVIGGDHVYYDLANLFGDEKQSADMNKFLNENQKEAAKEVIPAITKIVDSIIQKIVHGLIEQTPYNVLFLQ